MVKRTVVINISDEFVDFLTTNMANVQQAIGYLSSWAIHSENKCKVLITNDREGDLVATYSNEKGEVTYQIGAIQSDNGTFSFHS